MVPGVQRMKVTYHFNSFDEKRMLIAISNLLLYYTDVTVNIREKLRMLREERRIRDVLAQQLRKGTGNMSITIDTVFNAVENAIHQFNLSTDERERNQLFSIIYPALAKICQVWRNKIKPTYVFWSSDAFGLGIGIFGNLSFFSYICYTLI